VLPEPSVTARDRLAALLSAELLELVEALVDERVAVAIAPTSAAGTTVARWLTLDQAAERLGCTTDAIRMRVKRGRLEHRRQGRRLYVSADSVDRLG
jgi:excisionase family DNA binding protein